MASDDLRARVADAFRAAAFDCPGDCGMSETECYDAHPIQVEVLHFDEIAVIGGPVEALADVAVGVVELENAALRAELDELLDRLDGDTAGPDAKVSALLDQLAELLPDADPAEDMEHYLRQARVGHHRALRARDRRLAAEAERDKALAALQAVREAQSLGEALAAVAKHDGLTTDEAP